eukprot:5227433-Amphidinium_carterae.2
MPCCCSRHLLSRATTQTRDPKLFVQHCYHANELSRFGRLGGNHDTVVNKIKNTNPKKGKTQQTNSQRITPSAWTSHLWPHAWKRRPARHSLKAKLVRYIMEDKHPEGFFT